MSEHTWPETEPREVALESGDAHLVVDLRGGGLRALGTGDRELLEGYAAGAVPSGRRGHVLLPWPNRIRDGKWTWEGKALQLDIASTSRPTAIHGLVSWQRWEVLDSAADRVTVGTVVEARSGYPFRLAVAIDYLLTPDRMESTVRVRNAGDERAPFGVGLHPYLAVGSTQDGDLGQAELQLPARTLLVVDGDGLPTGERRPFDGAVGRIGDRAFDDPMTDLDRDADGWARVRIQSPVGQLELAVDASWPWLQVYSGDTLPAGQRRRSLAVEPMTCPPNALADGVDVVVLEPGADWSGAWTLSWSA
jgi:aldose 1-epimerase